MGAGMLGSSPLIAFAAAADLDRARVFYESTLGLRLVEQSPYAAVFDADGVMLRLTAVPEVVVAGYTVLGWRVDDIAATIDGLAARGVDFTRYDGMEQDGRGIWTTPNGDRVAWFRDVDGNTLSLTQFAS